MIWVINILISAGLLGALIMAKIYENKTGRSMWQKFRIEELRHKLEKKFSAILEWFHAFEIKHIYSYLGETWFVLKQFYGAVQKLTVERFEKIGSGNATYNGNKAASFYLKTIKEHKDKAMSEVNEDDLMRDESLG